MTATHGFPGLKLPSFDLMRLVGIWYMMPTVSYLPNFTIFGVPHGLHRLRCVLAGVSIRWWLKL